MPKCGPHSGTRCLCKVVLPLFRLYFWFPFLLPRFEIGPHSPQSVLTLAVELRMALNIYSSCLHLLNFQITGVDHFSCSVLCYTSNQELHPARQALHQLSPGPAPGPWFGSSFCAQSTVGEQGVGLSVSSVLIMSLFVCVFVFILTCLHCCSPGVWFSDDIPGMCAHACMLRISFLAQDVLAHNHRASLITSLELWCSQLPAEGVYGVSPSRV